jgi:hypothetical protein
MKIAWIGSFVCAALTFPTARALESMSVEVWEIAPHHRDTVTAYRLLFLMDAPDKNAPDYPQKVMEIYGIPANAPNRYLFVPAENFFHPPERLFHPEELPSLTLMRVDRQKSQDPLQVKTVYFFARWVAGGAGVVGVFLGSVWYYRRRRLKCRP